jgi:signal peptidase I
MTITVVDAPASDRPMVLVLGAVPELQVPVVERPQGRARHALPEPPPRRWVDQLLTGFAVIGILMASVTVFAATTGLRPLVVRSGSMEPTIHTGSMVLVRSIPARDIRVGDVVAVDRPDGTRVTHRVVSVVHNGRHAELVLKGDANPDNDPAPVVVTRGGRLVLSVPWLGRVGAFLTSAKGGFALGWLVAAVMLAVLRRETD